MRLLLRPATLGLLKNKGYDSDGSITGTVGTVLEKHLALSKATDAVFSVGSPAYWRKYIANGSQYIFAGGAPAGITTTGFSSGFTLQADDGWDQAAEGIVFSGVGNTSYVLSTGADYDGTTTGVSSTALTSALADRVGGYDLFTNTEEYDIDFLIMGGAEATKEATQAVASKLIAVAEVRQDAIAFISPHRQAFLNNTGADQEVVSSTTTMTDNVLDFYAPLPSSSYAVFDRDKKVLQINTKTFSNYKNIIVSGSLVFVMDSFKEKTNITEKEYFSIIKQTLNLVKDHTNKTLYIKFHPAQGSYIRKETLNYIEENFEFEHIICLEDSCLLEFEFLNSSNLSSSIALRIALIRF